MITKHLVRVRRYCGALPETTERLSHGEPTFFVHNKVFVMYDNHHHGDGHMAVWLPVPPGVQAALFAPKRLLSKAAATPAGPKPARKRGVK